MYNAGNDHMIGHYHSGQEGALWQEIVLIQMK